MRNRNISDSKLAARLIAILMAALIVAVASLTHISSTLASPGDIVKELTCESTVPVSRHIEVGATIDRTVSDVWEAYSIDPATATVNYTQGTSPNNIKITGVKAGEVGIAYGTREGVISSLPYLVTDSDNISAYTIVDGYELHFAEPGEAQYNPVEIPEGCGDFSRIEWSTTNENVATLDEDNDIVATGIGAAIIIGSFTDKWGVDRDLHLLVIVGTITDRSDLGGGGDGTGEIATVKPIVEVATAENGRVLGNELTGDGNWVEIARNGDFVLIMRADFINVHGNSSYNGDAKFQGAYYAVPAKANVPYVSSALRDVVNGWFNPHTPFDNKKLPAKARIREFTVKNDATMKAGAYNNINSGFSKPIPFYDDEGVDVAFVLSFGESVNYCSKEYLPSNTSPAPAPANFNKINTNSIPGYNQNPQGAYWLRTLGSINDTQSSPQQGTTCVTLSNGLNHEMKSTGHGGAGVPDCCLVYPAVWVHESIFDLD